jgi:hypothetical protein
MNIAMKCALNRRRLSEFIECHFIFRLDQLLYQAINLDNGLNNSTDLSEASEWDVAVTEIRAQLYMLSGHLLLRLAKEVCCLTCCIFSKPNN